MTKQKRSQETRHRILEAALKLFAQTGFETSSVAEICAEAGISKGAFYHHFPTKQAVFLALLEDWLGRLDLEMNAAREGAPNIAEALQRMSSMMRQVFKEAGGHLPMFLEFWMQASHDPTVWQALIAPYRRYNNYFKELIQQGIQDGSLAPIDPELAARLLVSLAVGILLQGMLDPNGVSWDEVAQNGLHLLIESWRQR